MEGQAQPDVISSLVGVFGLIAIIVGICSKRAVNAMRNGAIVGGLCVALFVGLLIAGGALSRNFDWSYVSGRLIGYGVTAVLFALLGYGIRKLFSLFFGLFRRPKPGEAFPANPGVKVPPT